jgi:hypothetical protein
MTVFWNNTTEMNEKEGDILQETKDLQTGICVTNALK